MVDKDGIFTINVRKCLRCGRLLTSADAVKDGYGHICKQKAQEEQTLKKPMTGQFSIFHYTNDEEENKA